jgi:hypothetical protein
VHEAYRKSVLKKFAETRELLLPYFKFEHFADRSMFTIPDRTVYQPVRVREKEKCCFGNGQLTSFFGRARHGAKSELLDTTTSYGMGRSASDVGRACRSEQHHGRDEMARGECAESFVQERVAKQIAAFELTSGIAQLGQ